MEPEVQRPTIELVARKANVSKTTISRFLNGRYEYMSKETQSRIQKVIEELNYWPSSSARSLRSKKSGLIGVIVADIGTAFSSILVKGIGDYCNAHGYHIVIANSDEDPGKERAYLESFVGGGMVEGLIVNTTGYNDNLLTEIGLNQPIVIAERAMAQLRFDTVGTDNHTTMHEALHHMQTAGFGPIAFFTQPIRMNSVRRARQQAYIDFCNVHAQQDPVLFEIDPSNLPEVASAVQRISEYGRGAHPAILSVNGVTTLAILKCAGELGIGIPQNLGICGYDDWDWASLISPGITTIAHPTYEVGKTAGELAIARVCGDDAEARNIQLPSTLHVRGSTILPVSS